MKYTILVFDIGDMNNVLGQNDKRGGPPYPSWLIRGFQQALDACELHDMELQGYQFTWERGHGTAKWVEIRLDRALVSRSWSEAFQDARLVNLTCSTSDHCPLLLEPTTVSKTPRYRKSKFENAWLREPVCKQIVQDSWSRNYNETLQVKTSSCLEEVSAWGHEFTGNFKERISHWRRVINSTKGRREEGARVSYQEASKNLNEVLVQQEIFWKQRSKQLWLREGDKNSKYFHATAKARRKSNHVQSLINEDGREVDWDDGLEQLMIDYFKKLFKASDISWDEVVRCITSKVSEEQNTNLKLPIENHEVKKALFHMHPDKSPGPDGMSPGFYQKFWSIVSEDITNLVKGFFSTGSFDAHLTDTNIVLVPKKQNPKYMTELRPISLCNVSYKIVSKVLANRLKEVIDKLISETQSAFIPGRLISENIMISYEIMYFMKRKTKGKKGWMALKLDMSKAYDRVEWSYVKAVLQNMGFEEDIITLFMTCVMTARYKISHAGKEFGDIIPERGLRQGDPLSSYLFLVCMEGLSALIKNYESRGIIKGIKVARGAPTVSHMFFADDSYIYCCANKEEAGHVMNMLKTFEAASGQKINVDKSSVFFSRNVEINTKEGVLEILGFHEADENTQYLGLPNCMGRNKSAILGYLKNRVRTKIQSWDGKLLNQGGKEVLLKTVAQAIPNYALSVFLIPMEMCRDMEKMMCKFWWNSNPRKSKSIHWMN